MNAAYYNERDPHAAGTLRNLIAAGLIAPGDVDERDILDVHPDDLRGYTQHHFFAGIGVWSYALRRAGWDDDRPVWTGSCPCQPFSSAGKGLGFDDERHLWPAWYWLIGERRPPVVFGEQVANSAVDPWIDLVHVDVEALDYAYGCVPFPSAGVGAPHIRDRAYWMAYATRERRERISRSWQDRIAEYREARRLADSDCGQRGGIAVVRGTERDGQDAGRPQGRGEPESRGAVRGLADTHRGISGQRRAIHGGGNSRSDAQSRPGSSSGRLPRWLADTHDDRRIAQASGALLDDQHHAEPCGGAAEGHADAGPTNGFWRTADWLLCRDGKWRPVEPGTFPLVDGAPARVGRLRAYGNAVNAEAAVAWIEACRGVIG
ncbi:DNA cytosine methyltransferase [Burkholderia ubonensis]|uniref:DNA cytosine methyltransferase n=1 Tax=Burkholderia ubonensis TaxID=101571 RepID=UPI0009B464A4|nr:DNA cytosine methyltransferase [Burkholderia ubonensis]